MSFSGKNDAESSRNFIKNSALHWKRAKLVQKSYGKFTESLRNFQDLSRRTHTGPYELIYEPIRAHMGPHGPIWPGPGPSRAEKVKKKHTFCLNNTFLLKIDVFDLQTLFFHCFKVFFKFLAEICLRTHIKSHQKASSRHKMCKFRTTCTLP